jgi:hypothetical protein
MKGDSGTISRRMLCLQSAVKAVRKSMAVMFGSLHGV